MTSGTSVLEHLAIEERLRSASALRLGPKQGRLKRGGLITVGDIVDDALAGYPVLRSLPAMGRQAKLTVEQRLAILGVSASADGRVDWEAFERRCGLGDGRPSAEVPVLADSDLCQPVENLQLGSRTPRLRAAGFATIADLIDDRTDGFAKILRSIGMGKGAVRLLNERLASLENSIGEDGLVDWALFHALWGGHLPDLPPDHDSKALPEAVRARPIEVLRLGSKAAYLHDAGIHTLGDLAEDGVISRLRLMPGIGPKTARLAPERLATIRRSSEEAGGEPDWDGIATDWGFVPTPEKPVDDSEAFLATLEEVIVTVIDAHGSEMDRLILSERISRPHSERMTLGAIGAAFDVTRERVRQRQVRILNNLSDALLNDDQSHVPIHFRESFRAFWVRAGQHFADIGELDYPEFVHGLEIAWGLSGEQLAPFMPLALAILADGIRPPPPGPELHPALETALVEVMNLPIFELPVGRAREGLEAAGLDTFGLLLEAARARQLPAGRDGKVAIEILNGVGRALAKGPRSNADAWAAGLGLTALPAIDPGSGAAFLEMLDGTLAEAADVNATSIRAGQIYRLRTCIPRHRRPSLQEVGESLLIHGPSVKREETVLLASLNTQLVTGDLTNARVVWRAGFLRWFAEAKDLYELADADYGLFCGSIARCWGLHIEEVRNRTEGLWAVLSLYPGGRRARVVKGRRADTFRPASPESVQPPSTTGVVVLRGFRRRH